MKRLLAAVVAACALVGCGGHTTAKTVTHQAGPLACAVGYPTPYGCQAHAPGFGVPPKGLTIAPRATTPSVAMADSVTVSALPRGLSAYAGYVNGNFAIFNAMVVAFPGTAHVPITVQAFPVYPSTAKMACLDIEPGDAVPASAGAWARGEISLGVKPCIYANLSTMPAVRASLDGAHLARSSYLLWVADWTGRPGIVSGFDATQWLDHGPGGENYDQNSVSHAFLRLVTPPAPLPVCFTHRMSRSACSAAKKRIASDQAASASSLRAYKARGCPTLSQRVSWFSTQLRKHPKVKTASRKRALVASRAAYRKQACSTFHSREVFFTAAAEKVRAES